MIFIDFLHNFINRRFLVIRTKPFVHSEMSTCLKITKYFGTNFVCFELIFEKYGYEILAFFMKQSPFWSIAADNAYFPMDIEKITSKILIAYYYVYLFIFCKLSLLMFISFYGLLSFSLTDKCLNVKVEENVV